MHTSPPSSAWLQRSLLADGLISGLSGLVMLLGAGALAALLGVPEALMRYAGVILLPFAATVLYWSRPENISPSRVWTVISLNLAWAAGSVLLLIAGWIEPTALGLAFVIFQAIVVAIFAELQYTGLRSVQGQTT
jgi:hypothetical protein